MRSLGFGVARAGYPATDFSLSLRGVQLSGDQRVSGDSGMAAREKEDLGPPPTEAPRHRTAVASARTKSEAVAALGRTYSFYSPEMNLLAETEIQTTAGAPAILYEYVWFKEHPVAQVDSESNTHWT